MLFFFFFFLRTDYTFVLPDCGKPSISQSSQLFCDPGSGLYPEQLQHLQSLNVFQTYLSSTHRACVEPGLAGPEILAHKVSVAASVRQNNPQKSMVRMMDYWGHLFFACMWTTESGLILLDSC